MAHARVGRRGRRELMAGLKKDKDLRDAIARRLSRGFAEHVAGFREDWPCRFSLGRPSKQEILSGFSQIAALVSTLRSWEQRQGVQVEYETREAGGPQRLPVRIVVPSIEAAATLATPRANERWSRVIERTQRRAAMLRERFCELDPGVHARVLRAYDGCDELEFELLLSAGSWFRAHDARGLTAREVPLPGIDGKWLGNARRQSMVCLLAGREELGLERMPASLEFAYLDPEHLARGGRRYDSWVDGDVQQTAYAPSVVIIVENKETYLKFPQVKGGICLFGSGKAGVALIGKLTWVDCAPHAVYWGDLDADGFEILDAYRARGLTCASMLMDTATLMRFERFGTDFEKNHKSLLTRARKELEHLSKEEAEAYDLLTSDTYAGHRRVEQERIPLSEAIRALADIVDNDGGSV